MVKMSMVSFEMKKLEIWPVQQVFIRLYEPNWLNYKDSLQSVKMSSWMEETSELSCFRMQM